MRRFFLLCVLLLFFILGIGGLGIIRFIRYQNHSTISVNFESGTSFRKISHILADHGIVPNPYFFEVIARALKKSSKIKAGEYEFAAGMHPLDVLEKMVRGEVKLYSFTIPEGWNLKEIGSFFVQKQFVASLEEWNQITQEPSLLKKYQASSLEGYLFPDTYFYPKNAKAKELVQKMLAEFDDGATPALVENAQRQGLTRHQWVTLASIIEKETGKAEERPLIASVFLNRLKINMPLQTDPTVIYGIPNFNGNLTRKDLETDHPYNTYMHVGLPPGPICSPGKDALMAVLNPANAEYLYFVAKGDGSHYFSKTLEEHNEAVRKYQLHKSPLP